MTSEYRATDPVTGAQKGRKPEDFSLLVPQFLAEMARVLDHGTQKYDRHNWRGGYPWSWSYAAMARHSMEKFWGENESLDKDSKLHHLAHAAVHLMFLYEFERLGLGTDDRIRPDGSFQ